MTAKELIEQALPPEIRGRNRTLPIGYHDYQMIAAESVVERLLLLLREAVVLGHIDLSDDEYGTGTEKRIREVLQPMRIEVLQQEEKNAVDNGKTSA